ncbi:NAD-dependent epimerase/dehydratase family protein [Aeoliella sp.]|uniref:NAD-dependent epimerase/dehydratase family protein n=1 Tax=Aeoliella sp. TaxID=2795800 RepID=UPI003CCBAE30
MRALITGGAGFIGSHTADALLARGYDVRILDSLEEPVHPQHKPPQYLDSRVELIRGDVRDEDMLLASMQGCEVIYHLAAFQDYLPIFSRFFDVNVTSTARIFELIVREKLPVNKVIVASSQATLGEGLYRDEKGRDCLPDIRPTEQLEKGLWDIESPDGYVGKLSWQPTTEEFANAQNQYGLSKIAEESVALHLGKRYQIPTVAMRYSIVQGPRQSFYNAYSGACRVFCLSFHQGLEPDIFEDGEQIRDFVNIHDVVDANMLVLEDSRADYRKFHVGGDRAYTVSEFAKVVASVYEVSDYEPRPSGKYRYGDTRHIYSDVSNLKSLGWTPQRSVEQSVLAYKEWLDQADSAASILEYCNQQMQKLGVVREVQK